MILTLSFSGLSNAELLSFGQDLDVILAPISVNIALIYDPFKQALTVCEETAADSISKQVAQQQTQELLVADLKRDNIFRGIKFILQAFLLHPDAEKREAAVELQKVVNKVGLNLHREGYDAQSALNRTFLADLDNEHTERITLLGIGEFIELLRNAQNEFDALRQEQLAQQAGMQDISSMTAVRGDLENTCKELLDILPGYYRMTGDAALGAVLPLIVELIERTN
jgi:hypothetical protein